MGQSPQKSPTCGVSQYRDFRFAQLPFAIGWQGFDFASNQRFGFVFILAFDYGTHRGGVHV